MLPYITSYLVPCCCLAFGIILDRDTETPVAGGNFGIDVVLQLQAGFCIVNIGFAFKLNLVVFVVGRCSNVVHGKTIVDKHS
jgi:hypothetical protein